MQTFNIYLETFFILTWNLEFKLVVFLTLCLTRTDKNLQKLNYALYGFH